MNTIYRIVWNVTLGKWVVASELAKGRKKKSSAKIAVLALALAGLGAPAAFAAETDSPEQTEEAVVAEESDFTITPFFAIGGGDDGGKTDNIAIGDGAMATTQNSVAIGRNAVVNDTASVAIGWGANTMGSNAIAMGYNATVSAIYGTSVGGGSSAFSLRASAFGTDAKALSGSATALGTRAVAGLLVPADPSDPTGPQKAIGANQTALGSSSTAEGDSATAVGYNTKAIGTRTVAVGDSATAQGSDGMIAIGMSAKASADKSNLEWSATAVGKNSVATGDGATAFGDSAKAEGSRAAAFGRDAQALQENATAFGAGTRVNATDGTAIGKGAQVAASANYGVALGVNSLADRGNAVSVGSSGIKRQIINVAAGTVDTDAVNLSQLKGTAQSVADALGGSASVNADGTVKAPSYTVADIANGGNKTVNNVGDALGQLNANTTNLDGRVTTNEGDIVDIRNQLGNGSIGLVKQDATSRDITVAAGTDGGRVDFTGVAGARKLAGVADGALSSTSNEAVNGSQLFATNGRVTKNEGDIIAIDGRVTKNEGDIVTIDGRVTKNEGDIVTIGDRVTGTETNITNLDGRVNKNEGDIVNIDGRVTTNEGDIVDIRNQLGNGLIGLVKQDATSRDITVAAGTDGGRVDFTGTAGARKLAGVADGALSSTSKEAVNGSQLFATNERVTKNEGDIVTIGDRVTSTETNITNLDGRVTTNEGDIVDIRNQLGNGSIGLVKQDATSRDITVAAGTDGGRVDFTGTAGARKLAGVAEGELSTTSKEAVNGSQLFATNERVTKNEGDIVTIGDRVTSTETNITNLDGRVTKNEGDIIDLGDRINNGSVGLVRQAGANAAVTVAAATGGTVVDLTGTDGTRQIKGVSEGTDDTDAVNVGQLKKAGLVGGDGSTLDAVVYDAGSNRGSVTFGGLGGTKLTNVMAGLVSATSTDAVNGSQLWILQDQVGKLGDRVTNIENAAPVNNPVTPAPAPGEGRDPAFAATGDGGPAAATGKDSVAAGAGAKASADNSAAIGAGSVADRANTVSVGSAGHERVVSNVAAGEQRTDAANWGQVQDALATANRYTDDRFDGVNRRIGEVQRQANRGIAASAALINVTPYMPGKTVLNAGVANYRGESALGVGVSRWNDTGRVNFNAGVSAAAGDSPIFRMGVGVVLGD